MPAGTRVLSGLGALASGARAVHLGRPLAAVRDACDAPLAKLGRPVLRARIEGLEFRGYLRHRSFLSNGARRDSSYVELFLGALRPGLTVVDGGAHIGVYTVLAARAVGPSGRVLAFEPDPYNFGALSWNVRRLADGAADVSPRALSAEAGVAPFHVSAGTLGSSLFARGDTATVATVETTTVDEALGGDEIADGLLVKLNVEGAEGLVLDGMRATLERVAEVTLFAEVHPELLRAAGTDASELRTTLEAAGFDVAWIPWHGRTAGPFPDRPDAHGHLLAVRGAGR
jgi:FkbM family methyltransferase